MKFKKPIILLLLSVFSISNLLSQDLKKLIPKDNYFIASFDLNKIKTKEGFAELAKMPMFEKLSETIGKEMFKDTIKSADYLDLKYYGIDASTKSYIYVSGNNKVIYGALLVNLSNEEAFTDFIKKLPKSSGDSIFNQGDVKFIINNELSIIWNKKQAALWYAGLSPFFKDSVRMEMNSRFAPPPPPPPPAIEEYGEATEFDDVIVEEGNVTEESVEEETVLEEDAVVEEEEIQEEETYAIEEGPAIVETEQDEVAIEEDYSEGEDYESEEEIIEEDYDYSQDPYYVTEHICDSVLNVWRTENKASFLADKGSNSLLYNKDFNLLVKKNPDMALYMDYGWVAPMYMSTLGSYALNADYSKLLSEIFNLYNGMKLYSTVDFNKDDVELNLNVKYSETLLEMYKDVKKKKISSKFLPYMDKNMMGYLALGIDIEGMSKGMGRFMKTYLPSIPEYGDAAVSVMELIDIIVDEKRLYNIFSGDALVAFNGMKPMQVIHTSYDYDGDFNRIDIVDTSIQVKPDVLVMLGVGNAGDVNKIFQLLIKAKLLKPMGNFYGLADGSNDFPFYFRVYNNILFMSTNSGFIENPVVNANMQLGKDHAKLFRKNTFVGYANVKNIADYFEKESPESYHSSIVYASENFSNITMTGKVKKKHGASSKYVLKLQETKENSVVDIFRFFNLLYVSKESNLRYD